MTELPKRIGWVGLGLMGLPMATNLLKKTDADTQFFVYDLIQESIDKLVKYGNGRVKACTSSKEVADQSVCLSIYSFVHSSNPSTSLNFVY